MLISLTQRRNLWIVQSYRLVQRFSKRSFLNVCDAGHNRLIVMYTVFVCTRRLNINYASSSHAYIHGTMTGSSFSSVRYEIIFDSYSQPRDTLHRFCQQVKVTLTLNSIVIAKNIRNSSPYATPWNLCEEKKTNTVEQLFSYTLN